MHRNHITTITLGSKEPSHNHKQAKIDAMIKLCKKPFFPSTKYGSSEEVAKIARDLGNFNKPNVNTDVNTDVNVDTKQLLREKVNSKGLLEKLKSLDMYHRKSNAHYLQAVICRRRQSLHALGNF